MDQRQEGQESQEPSRMVKEVETVIFLPATPNSELKSLLQNQDNILAQATNSPQIRFVERAGTTLMEDLGRNNPWASEWYCPRKDCLPCQGRAFLAKEEEEEAIKLVTGEGKKEKRNPDPSRKPDRKSVPSCTGEGMNYCIECVSCRKEGLRRIYVGETSRSL